MGQAVCFYGLPLFGPDAVNIKESCKQKSIAEMKKVPQNLHS